MKKKDVTVLAFGERFLLCAIRSPVASLDVLVAPRSAYISRSSPPTLKLMLAKATPDLDGLDFPLLGSPIRCARSFLFKIKCGRQFEIVLTASRSKRHFQGGGHAVRPRTMVQISVMIPPNTRKMKKASIQFANRFRHRCGSQRSSHCTEMAIARAF